MTTPETPVPPVWAESVLETILKPEDRESVTGDLLEEYRDSVYPARGRSAADRWYVAQVLGFLWRSTWAWAALMAAATTTRTALDWFDPPTDFHSRAALTTYFSLAVFVAVGFWAVRRSRSLAAAGFAAVSVVAIAGVARMTVTAVMFAIWHDALTQTAIANAGGLSEEFSLPVFLVVPAIVLATVGGLFAKATS